MEKDLEVFVKRMETLAIIPNEITIIPVNKGFKSGKDVMFKHVETAERLKDIQKLVETLEIMIKTPNLQHNNGIKGFIEGVRKLKSLLELIESKIFVFKGEECQEMERLNAEERELTMEIKLLQDRMSKPDYNQSAKFSASKQGSTCLNNAHSNLLPEVVDFQNFVAKYGHDDGWETEYHVKFIKLREMLGAGSENLYRKCSQTMLNVTYEMATEHDEWYTIYEQKSRANKEAILKWKKSRQNSNAAVKTIDIGLHPSEEKREFKAADIKLKEEREMKRFELQLWKREKERKAKEVADKQKSISKKDELARTLNMKQQLEHRNERLLQKEIEKELKLLEERHQISPSYQISKDTNRIVLSLQKEREDKVMRKKRLLFEAKAREEQKRNDRILKVKESVIKCVT